MPKYGVETRKRQARFRKSSSTISRLARAPSDDKGMRHGHLLAQGHEEENLYPGLRGADGAVKFFRDRGIKWHRTSRSGDVRGGKGPTRNMASSMVACVNFLLPLRDIPHALSAVARSIDSDVEDVIPIEHEGRVSPVEIEWIGLGRPLEVDARPTRGANVTSVDAFMVARAGSNLRAYLIEWKYVEDYRIGDYKGMGPRGETRRARYAHLYADESSSFHGGVHMDELLYEPFYQIMRLRLLADRMVKRRELNVTEAKVVVVVPRQNRAYRERITSEPLARRFPELRTVEEVVRSTLKHPGGFATVDYSMLIDAVERGCGEKAGVWAAYQRERYVP